MLAETLNSVLTVAPLIDNSIPSSVAKDGGNANALAVTHVGHACLLPHMLLLCCIASQLVFFSHMLLVLQQMDLYFAIVGGLAAFFTGLFFVFCFRRVCNQTRTVFVSPFA